MEKTLNPTDSLKSPPPAKISWMIKAAVVLCTIFFAAGSHFSTNALSTLKSDIKSNLNINNTQYGTAQAALYIINTFMPLFGGIFMDRFGTVPGAIMSVTLVLMGTILEAVSLNVKSFPLLVAGRVLHGTGSGIILVAQETILGLWFSDSIIATVVGFQIGASNLMSFVSQGTVVSFSKHTGFYGAGMWLAVGVCVISWVLTILYVFILKFSGKQLVIPSKRRMSLKRLLYLPAGFWLMPFTILVLGGVWTPFIGSVTEIVRKKFGTTAEIAAWTGSVSLAVPVLLSPVLGGLIDKFGHRSYSLLLCTGLTSLSLILLGFTMLTPFLGLTLFSISLTIGPVVLMSTISIILPHDMIGTGIGTHKAALSLGEAISHLLVGRIQDLTPNQSYEHVFKFLLALSFVGIVLSFVYTLYNRFRVYNLFDAPTVSRIRIKEDYGHVLPTVKSLDSKAPHTNYQVMPVGLLFFMQVVAWSLFIWSLASPKLS